MGSSLDSGTALAPSATDGGPETARDVELAKQVIDMDNMVDGLYDQVFREMLTS